MLQKPTEEYLLALKEEVRRNFEEQDRQVEHNREVRELKHRSVLSKDLRLVDADIKDPAVTDHGFRVSAILSLNDPTVIVTPVRETERAQRNATEREKWTRELLHVIGRISGGLDTFPSVVDAAVNDGVGVHKLVYDKECWDYRYSMRIKDFEDDEGYPNKEGAYSKERKFDEATEDAKKVAGPPLKWRPVDALCYYPIFQGDGIGEVLEISERPLIQAVRQFRLSASASGGVVTPEEVSAGLPLMRMEEMHRHTVEFIEHWDNEWVTYLVMPKGAGVREARIVKQWKHGYGRHPYFPAMGLMMNHWRNRKVGWGVNQAMLALVELRSFLWTLMANVAARDTFPLLQEVITDPSVPLTGDRGTDKGTVERWGLREIIRNRNGAKLEVIGMPSVAEAMKIHMSQIDQAISRLETPRITGEIGDLEGAGFALSQVLNEMMIRHKPIAGQIEQSIEDMVRFAWSLVRKKIREKVWIYTDARSGWIGMGPEELTDSVKLTVKLAPQQPQSVMVQQRIVHEAITSGTMSMDQAIEELGRNPDEVRRGKRMDKIRDSKVYDHLASQALLTELQRGDLESIALEVEGMVQSGQVPGMTSEQLGAVGAAMQGQQVPGADGQMMGQGPAPVEGPAPAGGAGVPVAPSGSVPGQPGAGMPFANAANVGGSTVV